MAIKADAYVDTSALIAFADQSDSHHALFRRLFADPPRLITTPLVVAEGHGWFLRRFDQGRALHFLALVDALSPLDVIDVGRKELDDAASLIKKFADQPLTLADALGLQVMQEQDIRSCWSTDRHLGLTGVPLVIYER